MTSGGSLGRALPRNRSPAPSQRVELKPSQIQHMLGEPFLLNFPDYSLSGSMKSEVDKTQFIELMVLYW